LLKELIDSKNYGTLANKGILAVTTSYAIFRVRAKDKNSSGRQE